MLSNEIMSEDLDSEIRIKNEISVLYKELLKREPDPRGLQFYLEQIKKKNLSFESLKKIIQKSEEYLQLNSSENSLIKDPDKFTFTEKYKQEYLEKFMDSIDGWLTKTSANVIKSLSNFQTDLKIVGGVGEIGVHHGKLFILLHLLSKKNERTFCIDVFENQDLNVDNSGKGSYDILLQNIKKFGNLKLIEIIKDSSLNVSSKKIKDKVGLVRLLSIDGGHTREAVKNDLKLSEECLTKGGIIILDDYFNPAWPGVSEGTLNYLTTTNSKLIPFAISPNKIYFTNDKENSENYYDNLTRTYSSKIIKKTEFLGNGVIVIGE